MNVMNEVERLKHYTKDYLYGNPLKLSDVERGDYHRMKLKECMLSAICYAFGYTDYRSTLLRGTNYRDQLSWMFRKQPEIKRIPKMVFDIGSGRGELTASIMATGVPCVAVDPSVGAKEIIGETVSKWLNDREREYYFLNMGILDAVKSPWFEQCDTVILCETIEHIPKTEFNEAWKLIKEQLSKDNGLFIVTNWVDYMPLKPNNKWEHVRLIDDRLYDELSSDAGEVVVREGSHLVLRF